MYLNTGIVKNKNESISYFDLINGSHIEFKGADRPEFLRGPTIDSLAMDECSIIKESVWSEILRPTLMIKKGEGVFTGTPKGKNWFHDIFQKGQDPLETEYKSFQMSSELSPFMPKSELEKYKKEFPERLYRQEILAEFSDDIGGVFRGVRECVRGDLVAPVIGHTYLMGVDLGKYEDFTVIAVMDITEKHVVAFDRFKDINWSLQEQRILNLAENYMPHILIDQGQVGDAILESLQAKYSDIEGIRFNNENKTAMINYLSNLIEKQEISYPEIPELIEELRIYEYEQLESGRLRMNAPSGRHDDCVIALALAAWGLHSIPEELDWNAGRIEVGKRQ